MKNILLSTVFAAIGSASFAGSPPVFETRDVYDPTFFAGVTWTFGGGTPGKAGVTLKYLSTNEPNVAAAAAGITYNFDNTIGCDLGVGYGIEEVTLTATYDLCQRAPQMSIGATHAPSTETVCVANCPSEF